MTSNPFWYAGPMPHDDFDPYLASDGYAEIDQILTQTLNSLDDLDIPSAGFPEPASERKHNRKTSGTAIFGFQNHNRELSLNMLHPGAFKTTKPEAQREMFMPQDFFLHAPPQPSTGQPSTGQPSTPAKPHKIDLQLVEKPHAARDFILATEKPSQYKFPATSSKTEEAGDRTFTLADVPDASFATPQKLAYAPPAEFARQSPFTVLAYRPAPMMFSEQTPAPAAFLGLIPNYLHTPDQRQSPYPPPPSQPSAGYAPYTQNYSTHSPYTGLNPLPTQSPQSCQTGAEFTPRFRLHGCNVTPQGHAYPSPLGLEPHDRGTPFATPTKPKRQFENQPPRLRFHMENPYVISEPDFITQGYSDLNPLRDAFSSPMRTSQEPVPFYPIPALGHGAASEVSSLASSPYRPHEPLASSPSAPFEWGYNEGPPPDESSFVVTGPPPLPLPVTPHKTRTIAWDEVVVNDNTPKTLDRISRLTPSPKRKAEPASTLEFGLIDTYIEGPDEDKLYRCMFDGCGKAGLRRYNIRSHVQTHLSDRPYKCDRCEKDFVRQHDLIRHYRIHEEGNLGCECGKKFTRNDALRRHRQRNVCLGGIPDPSGVTKPKKKRGRPRKVDQERVNSDLLESDAADWAS